MAKIRLDDVLRGLRLSYEAEAVGIAGRNKIISRDEERGIQTADLRGAVTGLRDGGPAGMRVKVAAVVEAAVERATMAIGGVNQASGPGHVYLSKAELAALSQRRPDLGARIQAVIAALDAGPIDPGPLLVRAQEALAAWAGNGPFPDVQILASAATPAGDRIDLEVPTKTGRLVARLTITSAPGPATVTGDVQILQPNPALDPALAAEMKAVLEAQGGQVTVRGLLPAGVLAAGAKGTYVAYEKGEGGAITRQIARVLAGGLVEAFVPTAANQALCRSLALSMALRQGEQLVAEADPSAQLELALRTANLTPAKLQRIGANDGSAVGFDPATELFQYQSPSLWGDNVAFVTFAKNGSFRVEDFN